MIILVLFLFINVTSAQISKSKAVFGFGFPELIHAGLGHDITPVNQLGFSVGFVPRAIESAFNISVEHRLYLFKLNEITGHKQWFFRQSYSYLSDREGGTLCFTLGKDLSKSPRHGISFDAGIQLPLEKGVGDRSYYGAVRLQYYLYFKRSK